MTNEEAKNRLNYNIDCKCKCCDKDCEKCCIAFNKAKEALEKTEKYKWHDLRKNPNDLPEIEFEFWETSKIVLVVTEGVCFKIAIYNYKQKEWLNFSTMSKLDDKVEFWKYEPFGEEEE